MKNKKELIRIVRTPQGNIELDGTGKKAGRGAYLCPAIECLNQAVKGKRLQKALEHEIPEEIFGILKQQIGEMFR